MPPTRLLPNCSAVPNDPAEVETLILQCIVWLCADQEGNDQVFGSLTYAKERGPVIFSNVLAASKGIPRLV